MTRVASLKELYGPKYRWDGGCCKCDGYDFDTEGWKKGYRIVCSCCGHWECFHNAGGTEVVHTSEGKWYSRRKGAAMPTGCPWNVRTGVNEAQDTPEVERGLEGPSRRNNLGGGASGLGVAAARPVTVGKRAGQSGEIGSTPKARGEAPRLGVDPARRPLFEPGVESHLCPSAGMVALEGVGPRRLAPSTGLGGV